MENITIWKGSDYVISGGSPYNSAFQLLPECHLHLKNIHVTSS
jgi:hypothetical protein